MIDLLPRIRGPKDFIESFEVSRETVDRLQIYADCLAFWQRRINLVSPTTIQDAWHRHFADSAQLIALAPPTVRSWFDLGTGAGFPGLVVAILLAEQPGLRPRMTLVESDQRKCAFLAEVLRKTAIGTVVPVDILCARIETMATRATLEPVDVVSARALAPLDRLLGLAAPLLRTSSVGLFLKGRNAEAELVDAKRAWQFSYDVLPSRSDAEAHIVCVRGPVVRMEG